VKQSTKNVLLFRADAALYCKIGLAVGALYTIPRFSFMPRTSIRIISHLHLSNKQVFKHSLKIPNNISELQSKKKAIESPYLDAIKEHTLSFKERPANLFDVHIKLFQYYFQIAT